MSLFDKYLPRHQFAERHSLLVDAGAREALDMFESADGSKDRIIQGLMAARAIPARVLRRLGLGSPVQSKSFAPAFIPLERNGDREVVRGLVGRFWRPDGGLAPIPDAAGFLAFDRPRTAKLVISLSAEPAGARTRLITETRIWCPDAYSQALLTPYWLVIRLPSGLIRRRMLSAVKRALDQRAAGAAPG